MSARTFTIWTVAAGAAAVILSSRRRTWRGHPDRVAVTGHHHLHRTRGSRRG